MDAFMDAHRGEYDREVELRMGEHPGLLLADCRSSVREHLYHKYGLREGYFDLGVRLRQQVERAQWREQRAREVRELKRKHPRLPFHEVERMMSVQEFCRPRTPDVDLTPADVGGGGSAAAAEGGALVVDLTGEED
jgi:hypothetical protein